VASGAALKGAIGARWGAGAISAKHLRATSAWHQQSRMGQNQVLRSTRKENAEARQALCASSSRRTTVPFGAFPLVRGDLWSGAGSNRRPSAFQVNRAKRYADLRKRTSPTSETALGGRCTIHASKTGHAPSTSCTAPLPEPRAEAGVRGPIRANRACLQQDSRYRVYPRAADGAR
jgi:hypothetical protein